MSVNRQISDDNGYSADENTEYLEKHDLGGPYLHESSQEKRGICPKIILKTISSTIMG